MTELEAAIRKVYGERVGRAIALIKPKVKHRDACRYDVETALINIEFIIGQLSSGDRPKTKDAKKAAKRLAVVLRKVEIVLMDKNLGTYINLYFPKAELSKWKVRCEVLAETPSGKLRRKKAETKRLAVSEAHLLMRKYAEPSSAEVTAKRSDFCRLAALLYGDPQADLHNQCRAHLRTKRG